MVFCNGSCFSIENSFKSLDIKFQNSYLCSVCRVVTVRGKCFLTVRISQGIFDRSSKILDVDKFSGKSKNFILIQKFHADYKKHFHHKRFR